MKRVSALIIVLCLVGLAAVRACAAATGLSVRNQSGLNRPAGDIPSKISPLVRQRLRTTMSRSAAVYAVISNPALKAALTDALTKVGFNAAEINTLPTRPIQPVNTGGTIGSAVGPEDQDYARVDWANGLTFTLTSVPTYFGGKYHVGDVVASNAIVTSVNPDVADVRAADARADTSASIAALWLELPQGPGTYIIELKLAKPDGTCPADLIGPSSTNTTRPLIAGISYYKGDTVQTVEVEGISFTPLADSSGYVGVVSLNPGSWADASGDISKTMRKVNATLYLECYVTPTIPRVFFSGFKITKL